MVGSYFNFQMLLNNSRIKTPVVSEHWRNMSNEERIKLISEKLKKDKKTNEFEIFKVLEDGQIILKINKSIKSNERGMILLDLEEQLKNTIDQALTVWLEPVGDKSKLRNLRGIKFQIE